MIFSGDNASVTLESSVKCQHIYKLEFEMSSSYYMFIVMSVLVFCKNMVATEGDPP